MWQIVGSSRGEWGKDESQSPKKESSPSPPNPPTVLRLDDEREKLTVTKTWRAGSGKVQPALVKWKCREPALEVAAGSTGKNWKTVVWRAWGKDAKPALALQPAPALEENRMCRNPAKPALEV
ncbi:hypothetical protein SLEP1_g29314 [Rubroshorea leprosula]|uniref:Uncharacterized protein n=1 Tax=Rubroshorea leprosula TaxID=152421 RepID=A0AAV5JWJ1_9ROSI|nr:hypothetical protein SLEP1_g29314 [Rubroshorea leprosula]